MKPRDESFWGGSWLRALAMGLPLLLASCKDEEVTLFVNPDGSGKIVAVVRVPVASGSGLGAELEAMGQETLLKALKEKGIIGPNMGKAEVMAAGFIEGTEGVEAWTNFRVQKTADGRDEVLLRGFFPDLNKLRVDGFRLPPKARNAATEASSVSLTTTASGQVFRLVAADAQAMSSQAAGGAKTKAPANLTEPEIAERVAESQQAAAQMATLSKGAFEPLKLKLTLHPLIAVFNPIVLKDVAKVEKRARADYDLICNAKLSKRQRQQLLHVFENLLINRLPHKSKEEIAMIFKFIDPKKTRFGQDMFAEGLEEGREEGREEGILGILLRQSRKKFQPLPKPVEHRIAQLTYQQGEELGEALLDMTSLAELRAWLKSHV